jgi:23S rRNA (adenine2503-C2)-methyltransferase
MSDSTSKPLELVFEPPRRGKPPRHLADLTEEERRVAVKEQGLPAFRADQMSRHWFSRLSDDPSTWTDIPAALRDQIGPVLLPQLLTPVTVQQADQGATVKTLWRLYDGALVESVLMRYTDRATACVSSQAGCGMACPFCATGQGGLMRNLSTAEIVSQVQRAAADMASGAVAGGVGRLSNVVFMGMGEPLANYKNVIAALHRMIDPAPGGLDLSARSVTVSTVGLAPQIRMLAKEGLQVTLAVSLHCPDDELRDTLVPINNRYPIKEVLDAAWEYADVTGRRVSIEYALIKDINDQKWRAEMLANRLRGKLVHVNLIPLNPTPGSKWTASRPEDEETFVETLRARGIAATVRDTRGRDIDGACGQLAATQPG